MADLIDWLAAESARLGVIADDPQTPDWKSLQAAAISTGYDNVLNWIGEHGTTGNGE